jgi:rod shape determining protein RodA
VAVAGLLVLYSALVGRTRDALPGQFLKQVVFVVIAAVAAVLVSRLEPRVVEVWSALVWAAIVGLLGLTLVIGSVHMGAQRWISLGPVNLQPSEFAKLAIVLGMARWFARHPRPGGYALRHLVPPAVLVAVPMALIFLQPDLGTTLFCGMVGASVVAIAGVRLRSLILVVALAAVSAPLAYNNLLEEYQRDRVRTFLNPESDPRGEGYQTLQARYAIGGGQMLGRGYLRGTQTQGGFLPEQHTDFVFAVVGEEFGFVGSAGLVALFTWWLLSGLGIALRARDRFSTVAAAGVVSIFFWQVVINLGGVLGFMPVTGLTLPMVSYGGSSMLLMGLCVGMMISVSRASSQAP